jgi:hypothetical protein
VYAYGFDILSQIIQDEKNMEDALRRFRIPNTPEQIQAGILELSKLNSVALIDHIAGGDVLKYEQAEKMTLGEVNVFLMYKQRVSFFNYKHQKIHDDKILAEQKQKRRK